MLVQTLPTRPAKPSPDFPLFPHSKGKWAKKINGRTHYFGRWDDPDGALEEYKRLIDKTPQPLGRPTVRDACNGFLASKKAAVEHKELSPVSFASYLLTAKWVVKYLGATTAIDALTPVRFGEFKREIATRRNVVGVGNEITRVRSIFKWAYEMRLIDEPLQFGPDFRRSSAKALRVHKRLAGKKLFTPDQVKLLIGECGYHLQAMIYLGINCGFGPGDLGAMPLDAVDLGAAWIHYPRQKTEVERDCPLWPETVQALRISLATRHQPRPEAEGLFFVMPSGRSWGGVNHTISKQFRAAMLRTEIRRGGFYWLRHTFATVAGGSKDQIAVNSIMGHADASMAAVYREEIEPERLIAVTEHVRVWLKPLAFV